MTAARQFLAGLGLACLAGQAAANCGPGMMPVLTCDILTADQRVEFCAERPDADGQSNRYSYNFAEALDAPELYFEDTGYYFSTKYYQPSQDAENTQGFGLAHGQHVYAFFVTGVDGGHVRMAQLHVYDSLDAFQSDRGETESLRLYCEPRSIQVNWDFIRP